MAVVVEEAAESELVEGVFGVFAVAEPAVEGIAEGVLALAAPQLIGVHGVKVGGVRGMSDGGDVRRALLPQVTGEVDGPEERVSLDFVCAVLAQTVLWPAAQLHDQVGRLGTELGLRGNVQRAFPVYHLRTGESLETAELALHLTASASHTFSCVSRGVVAKKGGWPTTISYKITPTLHQSHSWVYPAGN